MAKRRGAQPGNQNALKHGFYSHKFRAGDMEQLDAAMQSGLQDEINMMRVVTRRVFELAMMEPDQEPVDWVGALNALGAAATRIAGLIRVQKLVEGESNDVAQALSEALREVTSEIACK